MSPRFRDGFAVASALIVLSFSSVNKASAQSCYTKTTTGGASTVNVVSGSALPGTLVANVNARENDANDSSYYQVTSAYGLQIAAVSAAFVSGPISDNDRAPFGVTFLNGTTSPLTVTQADIISDPAKAGIFRAAPPLLPIVPGAGWSFIDSHHVRWTGSIIVPAKSGQSFIVDDRLPNFGSDVTDVLVGGSVTATNLGPPPVTTVYPATGFLTDIFVKRGPEKVATGVVGFVKGGAFPSTLTDDLLGGVPSTVTARVQEWANNQDIATGLKMTITIPAGFSNVSVLSAPPPWNAAGASISPPTSSTDGSVTIVTTANITSGSSTPDVQLRMTPPPVAVRSVFQMKASLDGFDTAGGPTGPHHIRTVCDGGGVIVPSVGGGALNVEFLSPRLNVSATSAPAELIDLRTDFNIINNAAGDTIRVDVWNVTNSAWDTLAPTPVVPGSTDYTLTKTLLPVDYLDASSRMKIRYVANAGAALTLRIDYLVWDAQLYWVVDNAVGNDAFAGTAIAPLKTLSGALLKVGSAEQVQVRVGSSQSGSAYFGNLSINKAGTALCKTLFQGVASGALLPKVDLGGIEAAADHVKVDSFQIDNAFEALRAIGVNGTVFSNNTINIPNVSFGVRLYLASNSTVLNNTIARLSGGPLEGIEDRQSTNSLIDGNRVTGLTGAFGILVFQSTSPLLQRNVIAQNSFGIDIAGVTTGAVLYNNTVANNSFGIVAESSAAAVTARNNIVAFNAVNYRSLPLVAAPSKINSNFDDVFGAAIPSQNYQNVPVGANSLAVNPLLNGTFGTTAASPCKNAGTSVGLPWAPFIGPAPDIGATEQ